MSASDQYPSDLAERFQIRMPPGLREQIAEAAKANNRSMNAEIVARLQLTLDNTNTVSGEHLIKRAAEEAAKSVVKELLSPLPQRPPPTKEELEHFLRALGFLGKDESLDVKIGTSARFKERKRV